VLRADGAPTLPDAHSARITVVGERVQLAPRRRAERRDERRLGDLRDLADGPDSTFAQLAGGHLADAPEPLDGQRMEKVELTVARHDEQAVRLRHTARHLGEEFRPRDADRDREAHALEHVASQPHRDLGCRAFEPLEAAHVEERLIDGDPLDERRRVLEHLEHSLARLRVGGHPRPDNDSGGAQPSRARAAHRRPDAVGLGLVAGCQHDTRTDDDGPPAQAGVVPLLDRREERIEVGVQDRSDSRHEHMFAYDR
jgi:hypothetical protein